MGIAEQRIQIVNAFQDKWQINDAAHRANHFEAVFQCALKISERLGINYDHKPMLFTAYFHDLFAWSRFNHHELSFHWMMTTDHPVICDNLKPAEMMLVAWACNQHRASFKGKFKYEFCELMNSADREEPGDVGRMLERAIMYRVGNHPEQSEDERYAESVKHLKEKFGSSGYARYPDMYLKCFKEELQKQRDEIAML
ncbi:hypothetical protein D3C75_688290 [compost metagenome]